MQGDAVADGPGQGFAVLGAEMLGNQDARAGGNAHEKRQQQIQHGRGVPHGGQSRIAPFAVADDYCVHGII